MKIWMDGALTDIEKARIDPRDRGFTLGDGLYETIRVSDGRILRLDKHLARLAAGLRLLRIASPFDETALTRALGETLDANTLSDAVLRLTISRGPAARGMAPDPAGQPTTMITAAPYSRPGPSRAVIATATRRNEHSPLSQVKSTNCLDSVLARIEAAERGGDEAILLNTAGRIAEASAANLFALIGGMLVTPPVADGALPGILRAEIIARLGATERPLSPADLTQSDEIFLTSSLGVRPVISLDGRVIPAGGMAARIAAEL
jgi:branched-chain amino acid aminotransferase